MYTTELNRYVARLEDTFEMPTLDDVAKLRRRAHLERSRTFWYGWCRFWGFLRNLTRFGSRQVRLLPGDCARYVGQAG